MLEISFKKKMITRNSRNILENILLIKKSKKDILHENEKVFETDKENATYHILWVI